MELLSGLQIIDLSLFFFNSKTLIISDLQLGYEDYLIKKGVLIPKFQFDDLYKKFEGLLEFLKPKLVVLNGDLKHELGTINKTEWKLLKLFDLIKKYCDFVVIKGNHDSIIKPILKKRGIKLVDEYVFEEYYVCHGHVIPNNRKFNDSKTIIIGHEHPAISLRDEGRVEKFKCFLKGSYEDKDLIVMPSFNVLTKGTDVLTQKTLSPFFDLNFKEFEVYVVSEKIKYFGKIKDIINR